MTGCLHISRPMPGSLRSLGTLLCCLFVASQPLVASAQCGCWHFVLELSASSFGQNLRVPTANRGTTKVQVGSSGPISFPAGTQEAAEVEAFWQTLDTIEAEITTRGLPAPREKTPHGDIGWTVDRAAVVTYYQTTGPGRFLALRLAVGNRTKEPLTIAGSSISAVIDGTAQLPRPLPKEVRTPSFLEQDINHPLDQCKTPEQMTVPAGGVASAWLIFPELDGDTTVPPVVLKFELHGTVREFDVTAHQRGLLNLKIERIGPQQSLALVTIGGLLTTFNLQSLVDEFDSLVNQKIARCVLRWSKNAPPLSSELTNWIQLSVSNAGTNQFRSDRRPTIPSQLRELHIVQPAGRSKLVDPNATRQNSVESRFHETDTAAVIAALKTSFLALDPVQLRDMMQRGHPLLRAAALVHGGRRLGPEDLPFLLALTRDADDSLRRSALTALRESGDPQAIDRLAEAARTGTGDDVAVAVRTLADSRFAAANDRLRELLASGEPALKERIVVQLCAEPRPAWSEELYAHALDAQGQPRMDVIRALVQLDHPQAVELLERGLQSGNPSLRDFSFQILSRRNDERSYRLAIEHVLNRLSDQPLDSTMIEFLSRSRDPRALPALVARLDQPRDRNSVISLLALLGDRSTGDRIVAGFDKFSPQEKQASIMALRQLRHPQFLEIAIRELSNPQATVAHSAIQGLLQDGSPLAISSLCQALEQEKRPELYPNLVQSLVSAATPQARETLQRLAQIDPPARRDAAKRGLENLKQSSPARNSIAQADAMVADKQKWRDAAELYRVATELDPYYREAFTKLAEISIRLEQWQAVAEAYGRALELQADDGNAITGLAIADMILDRPDAALKRIADARARFEKDPYFRYNTACVYGRGIERLQAQDATPARDEKLTSFRKQALAELSASLQLGFKELDWMQQDPDLKTLHGTPEFLELVAQAKRNPPAERPQQPSTDE